MDKLTGVTFDRVSLDAQVASNLFNVNCLFVHQLNLDDLIMKSGQLRRRCACLAILIEREMSK
jgi:hypothetical protein